MITKEQYLEAQKIVDAYNLQIEKSHIIPRYFVDIRSGCAAIRDKWHKSYDESYQGLHADTSDVVEYKHGYVHNATWTVSQEDIDHLNEVCKCMNGLNEL